MLEATATVSGSEAEVVVADVGSLGVALREAAAHVDAAARAVRDGKLEQVLAETRAILEADLRALRDVIDHAAEEGEDWLRERRHEHEQLSDEVREKLERVERIRRVLGLILPHLQAVARSLASAQRFVEVERRVLPEHPVAAEASRLALLLDLSGLWQSVLPDGSPMVPPRRVVRRRRRLARVRRAPSVRVRRRQQETDNRAGADLDRRPSDNRCVGEPGAARAGCLPRPRDLRPGAESDLLHGLGVRPRVAALRLEADTAAGRPDVPPLFGGRGQAERSRVASRRRRRLQSQRDGPAGHLGTVTVTVKTAAWECTATFFGTNTSQGPPARRCKRL